MDPKQCPHYHYTIFGKQKICSACQTPLKQSFAFLKYKTFYYLIGTIIAITVFFRLIIFAVNQSEQREANLRKALGPWYHIRSAAVNISSAWNSADKRYQYLQNLDTTTNHFKDYPQIPNEYVQYFLSPFDYKQGDALILILPKIQNP